MYSYLTPAIVLRKRDHREADRLYTLLTQEQGKVMVLAMGARRLGSKHAGALEAGAESQVMCIVGKKFDRLAGAEVIQAHGRQSAGDVWLRQRYLDAVDSLVQESHRDEKVYGAVREAMTAATSCTPEHHALSLWRLLEALGFAPRTDVCSVCQRILDEATVLLPRTHGFAHTTCAIGDEPALPVDEQTWQRVLAISAGLPPEPSVNGAQRALQQVIDSVIDLHAYRRRLVSVGFGV